MLALSAIFWTWITCCGVALIQGVLLGLNTWENRRFVGRRIQERQPGPNPGHVALLAPCKGVDLGLEDNLRQLFRQSFRPYEIIFIVEQSDDPAVPIVRRLMQEEHGIPSRLIVAGQGTTTGQKIHNLICAIEQLGDDVQVLAFVDSDVAPERDWLAKLVTRLARSDSGAITGYRWFIPSRISLANCLLYSINSSVAALLGAGGEFIVWGGSWAMRRSDFDAIGVRQDWEQTISDDLVATSTLKRAGLPIQFEPICMAASPIDYNICSLGSFLRRQYLIGRIYAPSFWYQTLSLMLVSSVAISGAIGMSIYGVFQGASWAPWPMAFLAVWYALQVFRAWVRGGMARHYISDWSTTLTWAVWFDMLGSPLTLFYNTALMLAACFGSRIHWRGITYILDRRGRLKGIRRPVEEASVSAGQRRLDDANSCLRPHAAGAPAPAFLCNRGQNR